MPIITKAFTIGPRDQLTLPAKLRKVYDIQPGTKLEVFPRVDGGFEIHVLRPSRILDYAGDLRHLDPKGKSQP